jgi:hypothetical protein
MMAAMATSRTPVSQLILDQLAQREMRVLALTVAIRKAMAGSPYFKADLSTTVKSALRTLVSSRVVVEVEGTYSLASHR